MFLQARKTQTQFHGYSVEFSPFVDTLVAVGTAQYFGIVGNGRQYVYEMLPEGGLTPIRAFDTPQGVYDCAWSENHGQELVTSCADGSVKLWHLETRDQFPIQNYHEHKHEVSGVNWNLVAKDSFASASWDGSIKIWKPEVPHSVLTLSEHSSAVYNAVWSTQDHSLVASCSGDGTVKIWDLNSGRAITTIAAHGNEVLALDWNKYNQFEVVSGSTDCSIKVWDIRNLAREVRMFPGHNYAVKKIKCSPHDPDVIASVSYDMSVGIWNTKSPYPRLQNAQHHSEFVFGFDFSLFWLHVRGIDKQSCGTTLVAHRRRRVKFVFVCAIERIIFDVYEDKMETPKKTGFWTQHVDASSGRTYYFNMALGRSYWKLPPEVQAQVEKPALDVLRDWDPETAERKYGVANEPPTAGDDEEIRRKREVALAKSRMETIETQVAASTKLSLEERMTLATYKRKAVEVQSSTSNNRLPASESSNEYLELVRQLQQNDNGEEGAGGKWLALYRSWKEIDFSSCADNFLGFKSKSS
ncbi:hypothetical protein DD237_007240 [Peronospora effusa]|uniref:Peroxin-7 n=1 Tax=Peronospora effusa TaxID=542832 RepID=A0A3R7VY53_9STRA|nr:hypothetical protein DD237_007240 [Peronospora effusa]